MLRTKIDDVSERLLKVISQIPFLDDTLTQLASLTGIHKSHAALSFVFLFVIIALSTSITSDLIGTLYPLYMSIKTIENRKSIPNARPLFQNLMAYWCIFFSFKVSFMIYTIYSGFFLLFLLPFPSVWTF